MEEATRTAGGRAVSAEKGRSLAVNKRKILESAQKHLQRGALDKALEDYQTLVKADPKDSNIRLKVGDLHLKLGRAQDAIDAYLRVAQQFTNEGFDAKAVALYKQITKLDDKRFEVHAQLGELYQRMGLTSEAMKAMQQAADGAHRAGDKTQALSLLRRMAALDPTNTANRLKVADLLRASGQADDAISEYDEVVRELGRQNNAEEQLRVLERALEISPGRVETLRTMAQVASETGDVARAENAARALLEAQPSDLETLELCGQALERAGRADEAADVFRNLAEKYRARGDDDRARALTQRYGAAEAFGAQDSDAPVLESDPTDMEIDPELDASLGLVDGDEIESDAASEPEESGTAAADDGGAEIEIGFDATEEATDESDGEGSGEVDPDADFDQLLAEAGVFLRYGKHERAVDALRAALRVEPGNPQALEKLGEALVAMGNKPHATSALSRAGAAYADAGDAAGVERVRAILAPLDAKAAAALVKVAPAAPPPSSAADDSGEIDIEIDPGLDEESVAEAPAPAAEPEDYSGIEIDVSADLAEPEAEPTVSDAAAPSDDAEESEFTFDPDEGAESESSDAAVGDAGEDSISSASFGDRARDPEQIDADFEEAEFFREQGMRDEARALYEKVLAAAPEHAKAMLRIGELDAAAPKSAAPAPAPKAKPAAPPAAKPAASPPPAVAAPPPVAAPTAAPSFELELSEDDDATPIPAPAPAPLAVEPALTDEEPVASEPEPPVASEEAPVEPLTAFAEPEPALGDADFDLAAELSGALDGSRAGASAANDGDGFAEVFAAFKAGVRREVDEGDTEAHFDLGIAYKEMGLLEDAIGEFRTAMGDASRRVACLHLMGVCALDLGRAADAVAHLSDALAGGALPAEQEAALRLDLGRSQAAVGDRARARSEYESVQRLAPGFGDVERLLADLEATPAEVDEPAQGEAFESFDDLLADDARAAAPPAPPAAAKYESFDELLVEEEAGVDSAPEPAAGLVEAEITLTDVAVEPEPEPEPAPAPAPPAPRAPAAAPAPAAPAPPQRRKKKISFV